MSDNNPLELNCPHCGKTITWSEDYPQRPFCSPRCRDIDFGAWATESYRVAGEPADDWTLDRQSQDDDNPSLQ